MAEIKGLTSKEVEVRKEKGQTNLIEQKIAKTNWQIVSDNVFTLFNLFNVLIAVALAFVHAYTNMAYMLIIIVNTCIGIIQEINAKKKVEKLSIIVSSKAKVIRDEKEVLILTDEVVLDDITVLAQGDQICADSEVLEGEIEVNESLLTGEADNILKKAGDKLLSGSYVVSGKCCAKVEKVGKDSFAHQITSEVKKHKKVNSELLNSMRKVTKLTTMVIIPVAILLFVGAHFFRAESMEDSVVSTAAALLGMLPKGLVLLISISLATGVIKLARKQVLVQQLHSVEMLAHVDVLCLDKTGTITEGKMSVSNLYKLNEKAMPICIEKAISTFCEKMEDNNATFMALKEQFNEKEDLTLIHKVPFSSERKWSSAAFENVGTIVIGAPEKLLDGNNYILPDEVAEAQKSGKRILLMGYSNVGAPNSTLSGYAPRVEKIAPGFNHESLQNLTIIAAIELDDPLKQNAKEMLGFFKEQGVQVKIISGDNPLTVSNIAKKAGLDEYESYIDLSKVKDEEIKDIVDKYSIFARVSPNQKSIIVKELQKKGHTVAMTGDGVNDVIALKEADCSITMSNGSDAAKKVSQIVLLGSDFGVLKDVLMEGRRVINNITSVARIFFIKTIYSMILSLLCILANIPFPFAPIQITLIDLAIEAYTSFFISFEPNDKAIKGKFLNTVIKNALPYSITIILALIAINVTTNIFNILNVTTIMYYTVAFVSILAVIKVCIPLNKIRLFLCSTTAVGFYVAAILFKKLLHLESLNKESIILFLVVAIICIPVKMLLSMIIYTPWRRSFWSILKKQQT